MLHSITAAQGGFVVADPGVISELWDKPWPSHLNTTLESRLTGFLQVVGKCIEKTSENKVKLIRKFLMSVLSTVFS